MPTIIRCALIEDRLLEEIQECVDKSQNHIFAVGLSGGSLPSLLSRILPRVVTDWTKWRFFFCDERLVPFEDPESTFGVYKRTLLANMSSISETQFVAIDQSLPQEEVAPDYERRMIAILGDRGLDLALLGMGPDGHTCSLFPGHRLDSSKSVSLVLNSPKPPPVRITVTLEFLKRCEFAIFVALGESKAQILKDILFDKKSGLPAGLVTCKRSVIWLLDSDSARLLPEALLSE